MSVLLRQRQSVQSLRAASRCFSSDGFKGRMPGHCTPKDSFGTMCLHAGQQPCPVTGSRIPAMYQNTGFVFKDTDDAATKFSLGEFGPIYSRIGNPTNDALEAKLAALEGGMAALTVSSGHAAQLLAFSNLMQSGDNFVALNKLYGGSATQFSRLFKQFGWEVRWTGEADYEKMEASIDEKTKAIYCEAICNPGGIIVDLERVAAIAKKHGIPLIVDNTTATPYLCRPFEWGADVVLHSATKFLSGHGNALGGVIIENGAFDFGSERFPLLSQPCNEYNGMVFNDVLGKDGPIAEMFGTKGSKGMAFAVAARALGLRDIGACLSPFNAFLINMGTETLPLRMDKCSSNALEVASFLEKHPKVSEVSYAGLPSSPYYALKEKYCPKGASSLFTFSLKSGFDGAKTLVNGLQMVSLVANLGDTRSLVAHPASMMHSQLTPEQRKTFGADADKIRMSIGIEDAADIIKDLSQALDRV